MWSSRFFWKIFWICVGPTVVASLVFAILITNQQDKTLREQLKNRLRVSAVFLQTAVEHLLPPGDADELQNTVRELGMRTETRLTVVTQEGRVLADSRQESLADVHQMDNHRSRPEILDALAEGLGYASRFSDTEKQDYIYIAVAFPKANPTHVARASVEATLIGQEIFRTHRLTWILVLFVCTFAVVAAYYLVARIIRPILKLQDATEAIAAGNYDQTIQVYGKDEVAMMGTSLNQMTAELVRRVSELRSRGDQMAAVLGGMVEGVIAVDERRRVVFANNAAGKMLSFYPKIAQGKPLIANIRDKTLHESVKRAIESTNIVEAQIKTWGANATVMAIHVSPLPGDPCPGAVVVLHDRTELKRLESLRQEFVANVSHELKTPLSAIKAYAETLREGAINDPQNNVLFLRRIEDQADRLHTLILDLISLARIESGEETFEASDVSVKDAVSLCFTNHHRNADAKNIELKKEPVAPDAMVRIDEEALRQILDNLVDNAIKYTPPHGVVAVRWSREDAMILIEVIDTGIGIDESNRERLFERFFRVDKARSRELGGTGLGLSIVKHLALAFGGTVRVESEAGKGSTFQVRLRESRTEVEKTGI